jgi:hypothetical protein
MRASIPLDVARSGSRLTFFNAGRPSQLRSDLVNIRKRLVGILALFQPAAHRFLVRVPNFFHTDLRSQGSRIDLP